MIQKRTNNIDNASIGVSVIIPFYGSKKDLKNCLEGIQNQNYVKPFEVIVVESGNDPDTWQQLNSIQNSALISSDKLLFPGRARNIGVKSSKGELLAFIDSDCVPYSNWLSEIYSTLTADIEIVIGPVINLYPFHPLASTDNLLQFPDFQKHCSINKITHFPACNLGMKKKLFLKMCGFPEDVVTGEDVKFSQLLITEVRDKIVYNKKLIVKHSGRKKLKSFIQHNNSLGFHRGMLNLKIFSGKNKFRGSFAFAFLFGIRRIVYITIRTLQYNPISMLRILFYFPVFLIGISAWVTGFWKGNLKFMEEQS